MVLAEKSFPRGGSGTSLKSASNEQENIIFGAIQKKKNNSNRGTHAAKDSLSDANIEISCVETLNYDTVREGMVIMGLVKSVDQICITLSLPGRMTAKVPAIYISKAYAKALSSFVENSTVAENFKILDSMYSAGQIVYGKVVEIKQNEFGRADITMSLKPSDVHSELVHSNIRKGFIFNGSIQEIQEHGYIIETGIEGLRCFLPLEKSKIGGSLGQLVFLKVVKINHDSSVSNCTCKEVPPENLKIKNQIEPNLDYLLPTNIVNFTVTKRLKDGLQGTIMNEAFTGYINEHQLNDPLAVPEDIEINSTLSARILYIMPLTKFVYLSLNLKCADEEPFFKRGDIIESAKVHHIGKGGVILILKNRFKGVISHKTVKANYKGNFDRDALLAKYAKKTQNKVRILDYNPMDSIYICTDDVNVVDEKIFTINDVSPGEFVTATVISKNKLDGYLVQIGKIKGFIERIFHATNTKMLEEKSKVRCRVIAVNNERRIVYLTNRPEYMSKSCKILSALTDAEENAHFTGTIVKCAETYFIVKFFNNLKGILYMKNITGIMANEISAFSEGQTMRFRIASRNDANIILGLPEDTYSLGEICPATVTHVFNTGLEITIENDEENEFMALVPVRLLSDFVDLLYAKLQTYKVGDVLQASCIVKNIFSVRDVEYFKHNLTKQWRTVQPGDILKAYVKNVDNDIIHILIPIQGYNKLVKVHFKMLLMNTLRNPNHQIVITPEQVVYVKILSKELETKTITVSAKLTDVWDGKFCSTANYVQQYLSEIDDIKEKLKILGDPVSKYCIGDKVSVVCKFTCPDTGDCKVEVKKSKVEGIIKKSLLFSKNQNLKDNVPFDCLIIWIDYANKLLYLSNKPGDIAHITSGRNIPTNLVGQSGISAKILLKLDSVFICSIKKGTNPIVYCTNRLHPNDFESSAGCGAGAEGEFCKLTFIHETLPIAVLEDTWKLWQQVNRKRKASSIENKKLPVPNKLAKSSNQINNDVMFYEDKNPSRIENGVLKEYSLNDIPSKQKKNGVLKEKSVNDIPSKQKKNGVLKEKSVNDIPSKQKKNGVLKEKSVNDIPSEQKRLLKEKSVNDIPSKQKKNGVLKKESVNDIPPKQEKPADKCDIPDISTFWSTDLKSINNDTKDCSQSSEDEDDTERTDVDMRKKKKSKSAEKFRNNREEEQRISKIEERNANLTGLPESADQFDRLILSDPNNSENWINYMVFHLQCTEIDKARAVGRKAIKTISFRNPEDQINIWVALLNLEQRYGTKESFATVFNESLTYNDPLKMYLRVLDILAGLNKTQDLNEIINVATRKFKDNMEIWKACANAYFSVGLQERAKQLLQRALVVLPQRDHVNTIVSFARLYHKHGIADQSQTLLDQVVTSYPKRVDVWSQYIDMLIKDNDIESARHTLERAILQKIPLKKMRTIFKKYLDLEEKFGTADDVQKVKLLAAEYVENQIK